MYHVHGVYNIYIMYMVYIIYIMYMVYIIYISCTWCILLQCTLYCACCIVSDVSALFLHTCLILFQDLDYSPAFYYSGCQRVVPVLIGECHSHSSFGQAKYSQNFTPLFDFHFSFVFGPYSYMYQAQCLRSFLFLFFFFSVTTAF